MTSRYTSAGSLSPHPPHSHHFPPPSASLRDVHSPLAPYCWPFAFGLTCWKSRMNTTLRHIYSPYTSPVTCTFGCIHQHTLPSFSRLPPSGPEYYNVSSQWISGHLHQSFADKMNYPIESAASTMTLDHYHLLLLHDTKKYISPELVHVYAIALKGDHHLNVCGSFAIVVTFARSAINACGSFAIVAMFTHSVAIALHAPL